LRSQHAGFDGDLSVGAHAGSTCIWALIASYVGPQDGEDFGIAVRYIAGYGDRSIAEHAFALLMSAPRGLSQMDREMRSGTWSAFEGEELRGKTLGIVGTGAVGAELCRIAAGFGMNCIAWNRSSVVSSLSCKEVPLKQVFRDADAVSLHIAFSDTMNKMVGAPFLQLMKPGAILVNTARGSVVDDVALVEALKTGPLGHAALDVYTVEPLKSGSPLRSMQNDTLSAHAAWKTPDAEDRLMERGLEILQDDIASL
tara:strand:- start:492 stop:1256 length:765 start_codon:yes stop_codon:yes gene_type:complete